MKRDRSHYGFARREILAALQDVDEGLTSKQIAERTGLNYSTVRVTLSRMIAKGLVSQGGYRIARD